MSILNRANGSASPARTYRSISGKVGVSAKKRIGMTAAATAAEMVIMFTIQCNAAFSGCAARPRMTKGSKTPTATLSQIMNRRIFALRRRFRTTISLLSANISKKSSCEWGIATARDAETTGGRGAAGRAAVGAGRGTVFGAGIGLSGGGGAAFFGAIFSIRTGGAGRGAGARFCGGTKFSGGGIIRGGRGAGRDGFISITLRIAIGGSGSG